MGEKAHPGILTDDLEAVQTRLVDVGVEVGPVGLASGFRRFTVDDCFGNGSSSSSPSSDLRGILGDVGLDHPAATRGAASDRPSCCRRTTFGCGVRN